MFELKKFIDGYSKITILSHIKPDGDTIGTVLGIYNLLKAEGKQVEVVNADRDLPLQLNFLPNFSKIKHQMDFDNSLIIACDGGSIDRFGFDIKDRDILNIDHHKSNSLFGLHNIVEPNYVSASQVAFEIFTKEYTFGVEVATCFYTALVSDSQYFITNNVNKEVFDVASDMIAYGIDISEIAYNLNQRKSLSSLRILASTLESLSLHFDGKLSVMVATRENIKKAGAKYNDMLGIVDYGISLATVKISIFIMESEDVTRISMRSDKEIDISPLAISFGGGGHKNASGFECKSENKEKIIDILILKIKEMELL
ncbi:MAG: DHH family phosphoesterase [Sulfurovaceae bacterium]|nr:DHH family phosphoesterase [Sulfurovaceae bacterium]